MLKRHSMAPLYLEVIWQTVTFSPQPKKSQKKKSEKRHKTLTMRCARPPTPTTPPTTINAADNPRLASEGE